MKYNTINGLITEKQEREHYNYITVYLHYNSAQGIN